MYDSLSKIEVNKKMLLTNNVLLNYYEFIIIKKIPLVFHIENWLLI